jgi:NAD(P)-dependent dehydrogenase (short-subunit alcohol dehydrogenase family)
MKTIVFIGGTSGIGRAAVQHFLKTEHKIILLYRSQEKLKETLKGSNKVVIEIPCDLYSFESMKKAIAEIRKHTNHVDILVNNAGMWEFGDRKETQEGIETTFQVNVLATAFFHKNLQDLLLKSSEPRVITTASLLHTGKINFEDLEYKRKFSGFQAYRQSKLAVILLTRYWSQQEPEIRYFSFHPGVVNTELGRSANWMMRLFFRWFGISPEKGAETLVYLTETPIDALKSGEYYTKKKVAKTATKESYDLAIAKRLDEEVVNYLSRFE